MYGRLKVAEQTCNCLFKELGVTECLEEDDTILPALKLLKIVDTFSFVRQEARHHEHESGTSRLIEFDDSRFVDDHPDSST